MILKKCLNSLILIVSMSPVVLSAAPSADDLFDAEEWQEAAAAYAEVTRANPDDGRAWYRLAVSSREAGDASTAQQALETADSLQYSPTRIGLERARLYISSGDNAAAVAELLGVAASGFTAVSVITGDKVLSGLAGDAAFDKLVTDMSVQAYPCEHDERFSQFDFWVGSWDVHDAGGNYAGSNVIERAERGCVLIENWSGASGSTGTSINYLDITGDSWVQIWNSASGSQIRIRGGITDSGMLLVGQIHYVASATTAPFRGLWTLLPDGRVRQFFEQSNDGGETWSPWFEGFYTRQTID